MLDSYPAFVSSYMTKSHGLPRSRGFAKRETIQQNPNSIRREMLASLGARAPVSAPDGLSFSQGGVELVPQAHGGALLRGGTPEMSAKGGGRPRSVVGLERSGVRP